MPITTIGDIITGNVPVLTSYQTQDPVENTAFYESGILTPTPYASEIAQGTSNIAVIPFWKPIDVSIEPNYSNDVYEDIATPRSIETGQMMCRVAYLNEAFGDADLVTELTNKDPLQSVAARLDNFWRRQAQRRLLATTLGLYNDNVGASDAYHIQGDMVIDVSAAGGFDANAFIDAEQTMGDAAEEGGVVAMHSYVYGQLRKKQLIDFVQDSEGTKRVAYYGNRRIVQDDEMTVIGTGASRKFINVLFNGGAIGYGEGTPKHPTETQRDASRANGGGIEVLWSRKTWLMHPLGYAFTSATITGNGTETRKMSASWQDLALATNWNRVMPRKQVPISFLVTGVAQA